MTELRSSNQQLKDELADMYRQMTDPVEQAKTRLKLRRREAIKQLEADYGI